MGESEAQSVQNASNKENGNIRWGTKSNMQNWMLWTNLILLFIAIANELDISNIHGNHNKNDKEIQCVIKQSQQFITTYAKRKPNI